MTKKQIEKKAKDFCKEDVCNCNECCDECVQNLERQKMIDFAYYALSHQWVSVEDELPPAKGRSDAISNRVIVRTIDNSYYMDHYDHTYKCWGTELIVKTKVTHWMPIPPLAEEGGEK